MDNVLIIRETNGKREFGHVDLNSRNVFNSPYYYLHQNDIVYVEPSRIRRQDANEFLRLYLPAITTVISTALTVYAVVQIANSQK
jgi:polysaccharide export outer membrane protein